MKRIDQVYDYVVNQTKNLSPTNLASESGVTTKEVAEFLKIQRSNASKDLNTLVREGIVEKLDGRPVRYVVKSIFQHEPLSKYVPSYQEETDATKLSKSNLIYSDDIFKRIIGIKGSMKNAIMQAKAAILYPPNGLNCLITGPTGSGKTYFAHTMFQYAKQQQIIDENKELVVFNCADYASNPELLMSHLFGHIKGAFTGADEEKDGLMTLANDGYLFLDEIHRLPPEGQEMIFYFMDNGKYSKLGESTKTREANVRIICATTEDPNSALLNTFVRRIPITIKLPNFKERSAKEKVELVKNMMIIEAQRINRRIILTEDVIKALIGSVSYGNVGQLKSNVQLVTAQSFLKHMDQQDVTITMDELNDGIKEGLVHLASDRHTMAELTQLLESKMIISPNESFETYEGDSYELPYNLYEIIGDKAALLKEDGFNQEAINHFITTDINVHLKSFYRNHGFNFDSENKLGEIIDSKVIKTTRMLYQYAVEQVGYKFEQNFLYAIGLHISSFLNRYKEGIQIETGNDENIIKMIETYPKEHHVAKVFKQIIEEEHQVILPQSEINYLTVLLISLNESVKDGRIGIVVAAHGRSTASSMVEVVSQLLKVNNIRAVDMPLDMSPTEALDKVIHEVSEVDEGSGVLLLVDMGSLTTFTEDIKEKTAINVKIIDMVTTALVLEAGRKASLLEGDLTDLYQSLSYFHGYHAKDTSEVSVEKNKPQAILAICASGQGTAQRMKELINDYLTLYMEEDIEVITMSIVDLETTLPLVQEKYHLLASTGIKNPNLSVPFITMDQLFSKEGPSFIGNIVSNTFTSDEEFTLTEDKAKKTCVDYINDYYTFINATKLIDPLWTICQKVDRDILSNKKEYSFYISLTMHLSGMVERILRNDTLSATTSELNQLENKNYIDSLKSSLSLLEQLFQLKIPNDELVYVVNIIENQLSL